MSDDFKAMSGLVEGTAGVFANSWKTRASCPDIQTRFGHPCSQGISRGTAQSYHAKSYHVKANSMNETTPYHTLEISMPILGYDVL